jgi:hypothetical protein
MRKALMSNQEGNATYLEDMTLDEHVELGDFGAHRCR